MENIPFPLFSTKFNIPASIHDLLVRQQLFQRLDLGLQKNNKLILLTAPAGYGKTTALSSWIRQSSQRFASSWLTLEPAENQFEHFFTIMAISLREYNPQIVRFVENIFAAPNPPSPDILASSLINILSGNQQELIIIFDDFHNIKNAAIHTTITLLLDHLPDHIHLVISTRVDPPLPLHRLRARGQLPQKSQQLQ